MTVRPRIAMAEETTEVIGEGRDARPRNVGAAIDVTSERLQLGAQRRTDALIGIDSKNPIMCSRLHRELTL